MGKEKGEECFGSTSFNFSHFGVQREEEEKGGEWKSRKKGKKEQFTPESISLNFLASEEEEEKGKREQESRFRGSRGKKKEKEKKHNVGCIPISISILPFGRVRGKGKKLARESKKKRRKEVQDMGLPFSFIRRKKRKEN